MDDQATTPERFLTMPGSARVEKVRRRLLKRPPRHRELPLRSLMFATRTSAGGEYWYALAARDEPRRRVWAGEVLYDCRRLKRDPLIAYLAIRLAWGVVFEGVEMADQPGRLLVAGQGAVLGSVVELETPKPTSLWRRFVGGTRRWQVSLGDAVVGYIDFEYPVDKKTVLTLQFSDGTALPIRLASLWLKRETKYVIPPQTPSAGDADLEALHFVLSVAFRTHIRANGA